MGSDSLLRCGVYKEDWGRLDTGGGRCLQVIWNGKGEGDQDEAVVQWRSCLKLGPSQ
jgi:hypothetical protein